MIVNDFTKNCLLVRREYRKLTAEGFRRHETDWELNRGARYDEVILEAKISVCGKFVYTKLGKKL